MRCRPEILSPAARDPVLDAASPYEPLSSGDVGPRRDRKGRGMGQERTENALDWARAVPDDDLVLALAIAAWQAERNPGLGSYFGYGVLESASWGVF